jgi:hypothetical protein
VRSGTSVALRFEFFPRRSQTLCSMHMGSPHWKFLFEIHSGCPTVEQSLLGSKSNVAESCFL